MFFSASNDFVVVGVAVRSKPVLFDPGDCPQKMCEGKLHGETCDFPELPSVDGSILVNDRITLRTANLVGPEAIRYNYMP